MTSNETNGIPVGSPQAAPAAQGANVMAVFGLIVGILSLLASPIPLFGIVNGLAYACVVLPVAGLILSILGRKRASLGAGGAGVALGGMIISIIALVFSLISAGCAVACDAAVDQMKVETAKQGVSLEQFNKDMQEATKRMEKDSANWEQFGKEMQKAAEEAQKQLPAAAQEAAAAAKEGADEAAADTEAEPAAEGQEQ